MNNMNKLSDYFKLLQTKFNLIINADNTFNLYSINRYNLNFGVVDNKIIHNRLKRASLPKI